MPMKKERGKMRSDRPSGRQTMETPEHSSTADSSSSLNQRQRPEARSEDKTQKKEKPATKKKAKEPEARQRPSNEPPGVENRKSKSAKK